MKYLNKIIDENYLEYANYTIKDRAIPSLDDGFKPVQRRFLHALWEMDDGKFNKVANIVGQTMKYHPHGDASIYGALVNLANKEYFIDKQGNFGNILTGDSSAAARYIEARLTPLAKDVLFNKDLTEYVDSYDGRNKEPITFPAKIPVLLLIGSEGIAVGMATHILPHNFCEVLQAQIAHLEGRDFRLYPDFLQGGIMDVTDYNDGNGRIKSRAALKIVNEKTILIKELPFGVTTESLIASIEKASKSGKLRISSINDYTTEEVEIEVNLARGYTASELESAFYAFTDCEISISPALLCIKDERPVIMTVSKVLRYYTDKLVGYLEEELQIELHELLEKAHFKTLARIFIENRIYKLIEELKDFELILTTVRDAFIPFKKELIREVTLADSEKLLELQIKRISRFDIDKNKEELIQINKTIEEVRINLARIIPFTIDYLNNLLTKYGHLYPRRTKLDNIEVITAKAAAIENIKFYHDRSTGYIGTAIKSESSIMVSEYSNIILMFSDGTYKVIKVGEKIFVGKGLIYYGKMEGDDANKRVFTVVYREKASKLCFIKRFASPKYILDKEYEFFPKNCKLEYFTLRRNLFFTCYLERLPRMRSFYENFEQEDHRVKGISAGGNRISTKNILKFKADKSETYNDENNQQMPGGNKKSVDDTFINEEEAERIIPVEPSLFDFNADDELN